MSAVKPLTTLTVLLASAAILAACDKGKTSGGDELAAGGVSAGSTADVPGALPLSLPAPTEPLPPAPPAAYAAPWRSARAQADRIRREENAYRQDVFAYDDGPADAWRDGDDIVRVADPRGRTFYYRPGEPDPYWATWDGRSYAYDGGRPTAVYYPDGRAEAIQGGLVAVALAALTEGRNLHQQAQRPHRAWAPPPGVVYGQGRADQLAADRGRVEQQRSAVDRDRDRVGADRGQQDRAQQAAAVQQQHADADRQRQEQARQASDQRRAQADQAHQQAVAARQQHADQGRQQAQARDHQSDQARQPAGRQPQQLVQQQARQQVAARQQAHEQAVAAQQQRAEAGRAQAAQQHQQAAQQHQQVAQQRQQAAAAQHPQPAQPSHAGHGGQHPQGPGGPPPQGAPGHGKHEGDHH